MNLDNLFTFVIGSLCATVAGVMMTMREGLPQALGPLFGAMIIATLIVGFCLAMASCLSLRKTIRSLTIGFGFGLLTGALADYLGHWTYLFGAVASIWTFYKIAGPRPAPRPRLSPMDPRL